MTFIEFTNKSKIILTPYKGEEKLRGFTTDYIFWPDMGVGDWLLENAGEQLGILTHRLPPQDGLVSPHEKPKTTNL